MATGFAAVRAGVVMFVLPFVFAFYPELLLIDSAKLDPAASTGAQVYIEGYGPGIDWLSLASVGARLALGLYLMAGALARFDMRSIGLPEAILRLVLAVAVMMKAGAIFLPALGLAAVYLLWHGSRAMRGGPVRA